MIIIIITHFKLPSCCPVEIKEHVVTQRKKTIQLSFPPLSQSGHKPRQQTRGGMRMTGMGRGALTDVDTWARFQMHRVQKSIHWYELCITDIYIITPQLQPGMGARKEHVQQGFCAVSPLPLQSGLVCPHCTSTKGPVKETLLAWVHRRPQSLCIVAGWCRLHSQERQSSQDGESVQCRWAVEWTQTAPPHVMNLIMARSAYSNSACIRASSSIKFTCTCKI